MKNIILIGMPGCGKTTIGYHLSKKCNCPFFDLDQEIEKRTKQSINDLFQLYGEDYFRKEESLTLKELLKKEHFVLATGGGVILKHENMEWIKRKNNRIIYIKRKLSNIMKTLNYNRPLLSNNEENLKRLYEERKKLYEKYADDVIENDRLPAQAVRQIMELME